MIKMIEQVAYVSIAISSIALLIIGIACIITGRPCFEPIVIGLLSAILFKVSVILKIQ